MKIGTVTKDKGKLIASSILFCMLVYGYAARAQSSREKKLNVIIILSDDQGYGDFSCYGNPVLKTPALDKLYNESIRFSNFHVTPLCTPTRGELITGLDALHNKAMTVGTGRNILRRDIVTMPEVFRENGYRTGIFGKWHLGDNYPDRPMDRGFEKSIWFKGWGLLSEAEFDNDYYKTRYLDDIETKYSDKYCTDLWFDEAMKWMGEIAEKKQSFFVYLPTNAPHGPYYAPKEDYEFYKNKVEDSATAKFFGMIRNLDKNMDRLEKWLQENKLKENTVIVFMNDNGGTGGVKLYNAGMRGKKGSNYEGGHRAACFIKWPDGIIANNRTVHFATQIQDLFPTFMDLLNLKTKAPQKLDGISLKSALIDNGRKLDDRMFVVQYGGDNLPQKYFSCVVWNSWRLVGENELYDISEDSAQQNNLAAANPDVLKKMQDFYQSWWNKTQPGINKFVPLVVGSKYENPVTLTSDSWADSFYVNTQWKVAQAGGSLKGGVWHIEVVKGGKYKIELSRWPFHLERNLTEIGPGTAIGGTALRKGKAIGIEFGCVSLDSASPLIFEKKNGDATKITVEMNIPEGEHTIQCWFRDEKGLDVCGAYYLRLEKKY